MRPGGGKDKGSAWERDAGKHLSLWLTGGARGDIFSRNVLSGGSFTSAQNKGQQSSRMPGDLMAAHPLAFEFMSQYLVECKHLKSLGLELLLYDVSQRSPLAQIIALSAAQARASGLSFLILAKQNHKEPLIISSGITGDRILRAMARGTRATIFPMHHYLHKRSIFVMRLADMLNKADPGVFLAQEK